MKNRATAIYREETEGSTRNPPPPPPGAPLIPVLLFRLFFPEAITGRDLLRLINAFAHELLRETLGLRSLISRDIENRPLPPLQFCLLLSLFLSLVNLF